MLHKASSPALVLDAIGNLVSPSIQGQNNRSNVYLLDGVNNNEAVSGSEIITPVPDDVQEMKVLTHYDSSQFGGGLGGTINLVTKSGTNQFHGGAWEFWRGSKFGMRRAIRAESYRTYIKTSLARMSAGRC